MWLSRTDHETVKEMKWELGVNRVCAHLSGQRNALLAPLLNEVKPSFPCHFHETGLQVHTSFHIKCLHEGLNHQQHQC